MRLIVENFGPIEKADIRINVLNIFIGKNSTGKSYLAYLIWCFLAVEPDWNKFGELIEKYVPNELISKTIEEKTTEKELDNLTYEISKGIESIIFEVFENFDSIWGRNLEELIKGVFLVDSLKELIRSGKDTAKILVCNDDCTMKIHVEINEKGLTARVDEDVIEYIKDVKGIFLLVTKEQQHLVLHMAHLQRNNIYVEYIYRDAELFSILFKAIQVVFDWIFDGYVPYYATFIAPDGRDGLIRSREVYLHALLSNVVINEVDRRFMKFLESLYPKVKNEKINDIASFIEKKLGIKYILQRGIPRYVISIDDLKIPIQRAPSGYKEIAPLVYAMKFGLDEGYTVIVEEPEAHLHPDAQVVITRALAKLSKYADVIITTHSITVLDEISNLLKVNGLSSDEKKELGYDEDEGLSPENLGIYLFSDGKVEELEVYEDGIEETELDRVIIEIANMHAKVDEYYERSKRLQAQR